MGAAGSAVPTAPPFPATVADGSGTMTVAGTARITGAMMVLLMAGAAFGWTRITVSGLVTDPQGLTVTGNPAWVFGPMLLAFIAVMVGSFKPKAAPIATPIYAVLEGVALGAISHMYGARYEGIVLQALLTTAGVVLAMALLYTSGKFRVTTKMRKMVMAATMGIALAYFVGIVGSLFSDSFAFWNNSGPLGIGISVVIVAVAAFNLLLDFDFIERGSAQGLPGYYNFVGALGLLTTVVWLYLEILRLLSKLRD